MVSFKQMIIEELTKSSDNYKIELNSRIDKHVELSKELPYTKECISNLNKMNMLGGYLGMAAHLLAVIDGSRQWNFAGDDSRQLAALSQNHDNVE